MAYSARPPATRPVPIEKKTGFLAIFCSWFLPGNSACLLTTNCNSAEAELIARLLPGRKNTALFSREMGVADAQFANPFHGGVKFFHTRDRAYPDAVYALAIDSIVADDHIRHTGIE